MERGKMNLTVLSDRQIQRLHEASLRILSTIGVHMPHGEMRGLFRNAGADVNDPDGIVKTTLDRYL